MRELLRVCTALAPAWGEGPYGMVIAPNLGSHLQGHITDMGSVVSAVNRRAGMPRFVRGSSRIWPGDGR